MIAPLLALAAAAAAVPPADLPGVWEGTVGNLPVRACFVGRDSGAFGAYYYSSRLQLIPLHAEEGARTAFTEGAGDDADAPRWSIERAEGGRLTGRWTAGRRTLPLRLTRIAAAEGDDGACSSLAFHQPRLAGVRTVSARATKDGVGYTRMTLDTGGRFEVSFETFALDGTSEAVRRINAALGRGLAGDPPQWFECIHDSLSYSPMEGSFDESLAPAMISSRWMSVAHHWDGFCGGAHPDSSNSYRTFDLTSGAEIDLHDWLNSRAVKVERFEGSEDASKTLEPAFREVVLGAWRAEDAECDEVIRGQEYWNIGLTRSGLVFSPQLPHVAQACGEEFTVPIDRLRPFLTDEGAANLRALQGESVPG
ncbi:MAG TPA: hypothetical protein VGX37_10070 [Allosphingosinicella sp.]|nr:hypothetical protein [Allosphingosinicella sp.]